MFLLLQSCLFNLNFIEIASFCWRQQLVEAFYQDYYYFFISAEMKLLTDGVQSVMSQKPAHSNPNKHSYNIC